MISNTTPTNPHLDGMRITFAADLLAKPMTGAELRSAVYQLRADPDQADLLCEGATLVELNDAYQGGSMILEAVTAVASRLNSRVAALARAMRRSLPDGLEIGEPLIDKPRKNGLFASVAVQIPFSDGQAVSVIFHAPDGDPLKVNPDDTLIAFRWLLNRRDITQVVAPEKGRDITLEQVSMRVMQLVAENSPKFQERISTVTKERESVTVAKTQVDALTAENQAVIDTMVMAHADLDDAEAKIAKLEGEIAKQQQTNAELEADIEALRATGVSKADSDKVPDGQETDEQGGDMSAKGIDDAKQAVQGVSVQEQVATLLNSALPKDVGRLAERLGLPVGETRSVDELVELIKGQDPTVVKMAMQELFNGGSESKSALTIDAKAAELVARMTASDRGLVLRGFAPEAMLDEAIAAGFNPKAMILAMQDALEGLGNSQNDGAGTLARLRMTEPDTNGSGDVSGQTEAPDVDKGQVESETANGGNSGSQSTGLAATLARLEALIRGDLDNDIDTYDAALDEIADAIEAAGAMDQYEAQLNQAADRLTELLAEVA